MKKLNKAQLSQRSELINKLNEQRTIVLDAIEHYNALLGDVESFRDSIVSEMESYGEDRSDEWKESDAGQAYESWVDQWRDLETDAIDMDDQFDHNIAIIDLPEVPE